MGTIITRRDGKVSILGNCGRGLRIAEGKPYMILIQENDLNKLNEDWIGYAIDLEAQVCSSIESIPS